MKKLLLIAATALAAVFMSACNKTDSGNGITASIIGAWQDVSYSISFTDMDGNSVSTREVIIALYKYNGMTDEQIASVIDKAVAAMEEITSMSGRTRYYFEDGGKFKTSSLMSDDRWSEPAELGTYSLDGNILTMHITPGEIESKYTVLTLNNTELKLLGDSSEVEVYEKIGYKGKGIVVYKRL